MTLDPIGYIRTEAAQKFHTSHQPSETGPQQCVLELLPDPRFLSALADLEGFTRIWIVWWFHRTTPSWRPKVLPPRGARQRRGLFATRSPKRPNPIAITPVKLLGIDGYRLLLGPCDAIDGSPVLDIKPYIPSYDAFPDERAGWVDVTEAALKQPAPYTVAFTPLALAQADWLLTHFQIELVTRVSEILARDPTPHRTRRIRRLQTESRIECGAWRLYFQYDATHLQVLRIEPGFPPERLDAYADAQDRAAQQAFAQAFVKR